MSCGAGGGGLFWTGNKFARDTGKDITSEIYPRI
jgi:hypothetical protein